MADDNRFGEIISKCWYDADFKKRFLAEPKKVLAEFGMDLPSGLDVKVVENTDKVMYLTLPPNPKALGGELSDNQLDAVSGGAGQVQAIGPTQVGVARPVVVSKLTTFQVATTGTQNTCTQGKECVPH